MQDLSADLRYGLRQLANHPGFSVIAVLILALGIGAGSAVFSLANASLLRPLPGIADPDRLISFYRIQANDSFDNMSYPDYLDYRDRNQTLSGLAAHCGAFMAFRNGTAERVAGDAVTGNYFDVLGVKPVMGRLLDSNDDRAGASPVAVLSFGLWQRKFNADRSVVGTTATLNGNPFIIVGIAPRDFRGTETGQPFDLWVPLSTVRQSIPRLSAAILDERNAGWLNIFGRLKPGATLPQAQAEMKTIASRLAAAYPITNEGRSVALIRGIGLYPGDRAEVSRLIGILSVAVALLLLIACANSAGLFLVRAWRRQREIAVRLALGASRSRLVRQLLTEGMLVAWLAGAVGLALSVWVAKWMAAVRPGSVLHNLDVSLDARVAGFALIATLVTGLFFALAPALRSLPVDLVAPLKDGTAGAGFRRSRLQRMLVVAQVAVSFLLVSSAGLLLRDLFHIMTASPGYETHNLGMGSVDLIIQGYSQPRGEAFYRQLMDRMPQLPGVVSAALASTVPPTEWPGRVSVFYPGQEPPQELLHDREMQLGLRVDINRVSPDYFRTLGIALLEGRDFTRHDDRSAPGVVMVNQSLARRLWPRETAIGKRISVPDPLGERRPPMEVIGVAADTKSRAFTEDAVLLMYLPVLQNYDGRTYLVVRTETNPTAVLSQVEGLLHTLDKDLPLYGAQTMGEHVARSLWQQRMLAAWVAAFATLALVLAAIGLYGLVAQSMAQRTREVGIRIALGAAPHTVTGLVVREGMMLALAGLAIGVPVGLDLSGMLRGLIPGLSGGNPSSFLAAALVLLFVMLAACWIPARRAANVDPVQALRME